MKSICHSFWSTILWWKNNKWQKNFKILILINVFFFFFKNTNIFLNGPFSLQKWHALITPRSHNWQKTVFYVTLRSNKGEIVMISNGYSPCLLEDLPHFSWQNSIYSPICKNKSTQNYPICYFVSPHKN